MNHSWRLITPGARYAPAAGPDDLVANELRELAARDRAAGRDPGDWSPEERERWMGGRYGPRRMMAFYTPVRWPERMVAPGVSALRSHAGQPRPRRCCGDSDDCHAVDGQRNGRREATDRGRPSVQQPEPAV